MQMTREMMGSLIGGTAVAAALALFTITYEPPLPANRGTGGAQHPDHRRDVRLIGRRDPQSLMDARPSNPRRASS